MWTTTIKSKTITNGLLQVVVEFSDGTQTFTDRYETRNAQDANWLDDNIKRRIADLDGVVAFANTISTGVYVPSPTEIVTVVDETKLTPRERYEKRLAKFGKMVEAIKKGIIAEDNTDFVTLKTWLATNWDISYFDLF